MEAELIELKEKEIGKKEEGGRGKGLGPSCFIQSVYCNGVPDEALGIKKNEISPLINFVSV